MQNKQGNITSKELHKEAEDYANRLVSDFSTKLVTQAKILASDDEMVLKSHVTKAYRIITNKIKDQWLPELLKITGSAFFGGSVMAFINESSLQTIRPFWLVVHFTLTLTGLLLIFLGFLMDFRER